MKIWKFLKAIVGKEKYYYASHYWESKGKGNFPSLFKKVSKQKMKAKGKNLLGTKIIHLNIETPDGMNQCVHPDIIEAGKDRYLMSLTPYPFGLDRYENPVIYVSTDLKNWKTLSEELDLPDEKCHFSDATIVLHEGKLKCYYRECRYDNMPHITNIYVRESDDGRSWSERETIFSSEINKKDLLSPSISLSYIKDRKHAYFCIKEDEEITLRYIEDFKEKFVDERVIEIINMPEGKSVWHIGDVPYTEEANLLLITVKNDNDGTDTELYIGKHNKNEAFVVIEKKILIKEKIKGIVSEYRATGLMVNSQLKIVCSVMFDDRTWGCILIEE